MWFLIGKGWFFVDLYCKLVLVTCFFFLRLGCQGQPRRLRLVTQGDGARWTAACSYAYSLTLVVGGTYANFVTVLMRRLLLKQPVPCLGPS